MVKTLDKPRTSEPVTHPCPLLKCKIDYGLCYEINLVVVGLCKPSLINDIVTKEEAMRICVSCENTVW